MVVSLYVTTVMRRSGVLETRGTAPMCHGGECARSTSTLRWSESVEVYIPPGPHQGAPVVFGYTYLHVKDVHLIYIGTYTYKYIEHESANWLGCAGRRATPIDVERHSLRCGWGHCRDTASDSDCHESISVRRDRDPHYVGFNACS